MRAIEQRLARLEQAAAPAVTLYAFAQPGETMKQAIARQFPDGAPENATVVVYRFQGDAESDVSSSGNSSCCP